MDVPREEVLRSIRRFFHLAPLKYSGKKKGSLDLDITIGIAHARVYNLNVQSHQTDGTRTKQKGPGDGGKDQGPCEVVDERREQSGMRSVAARSIVPHLSPPELTTLCR